LTTDWEYYRAAGEKAFLEQDFSVAEANWRQAKDIAESFDKYDPRVTVAYEGLSEALWHQGQLEEAEKLCQYVLHLFRVTRGPTHPDYGVVSNNLAMLNHFQGKYEQAEQNYQRALEILSRSLGPGHAHVVAISTNYSDLLKLMGRDKEAEQIKMETLRSSDLVRSGNFQNAEPAKSKGGASGEDKPQAFPASQSAPAAAAQDMTRAAQPGHAPNTFSQQPPPAAAAPLEPMRNPMDGPVGSSAEEKWENSRAQGEAAVVAEDWTKAEFFWLSAVRAAESFPIRDPRLCKSLESLAEVYWKQAKYNMAEPLSRRVLGIYEAVLGKNHPDVGFVANNLGMLYHAQGNLKTAATLYERALPLLVAKLGAQHPSVFNLETNLKNVLIALGRTEDAEAVKQKLNAAQQKRWTRSGKFEVYSAAG
jgi:tetratricopeptide (TPR) repeat protein